MVSTVALDQSLVFFVLSGISGFLPEVKRLITSFK